MSLALGPGKGGIEPTASLDLHVGQHVDYIKSLDTRRDEIAYWLTEHLRLSGIYWGLTATHLLGSPNALPRSKLLDFVFSCLHDDGGFGAGPGHDAHLLYTLSAIQIIVILDALDEFEAKMPQCRQRTGHFIAKLQDPVNGTFSGDEWGETDTRFLYSALNALSLLGCLHLINVEKAVEHVAACQNVDGAFGSAPGAESHAAQVFTCVGALAIVERLDVLDPDRLAGWLSERQLPVGGFNGRPEKLEDVCYSWWVMSSLAMIDRLHWIDKHKITEFILRCQDPKLGGISDRPDDMVDVYHTHFGIAGLSLVGHEGLAPIDPIYCMPDAVIKRHFATVPTA